MRILRDIMALSLVFLLALLPPVQAVGEKVRIAYVNDIIICGHDLGAGTNWTFFSTLSITNIILFNSEKAKDAFDSFVKAASDKFKIMKIIDVPKSTSDFRLRKMHEQDSVTAYASRYIDLETGEYKSDCVDRDFVGTIYVDFRVGSRGYVCRVECYEVEASEAEAISDKLLFNPCQERQAPPIDEAKNDQNRQAAQRSRQQAAFINEIINQLPKWELEAEAERSGDNGVDRRAGTYASEHLELRSNFADEEQELESYMHNWDANNPRATTRERLFEEKRYVEDKAANFEQLVKDWEAADNPAVAKISNGFVVIGAILAIIGAGGIGLYIRHNRKKEEERRKMEERNKRLRGWIHRMMGIIRRNSEVTE
jgi:flagellar biosynthesis GTPase FlhF